MYNFLLNIFKCNNIKLKIKTLKVFFLFFLNKKKKKKLIGNFITYSQKFHSIFIPFLKTLLDQEIEIKLLSLKILWDVIHIWKYLQEYIYFSSNNNETLLFILIKFIDGITIIVFLNYYYSTFFFIKILYWKFN